MKNYDKWEYVPSISPDAANVLIELIRKLPNYPTMFTDDKLAAKCQQEWRDVVSWCISAVGLTEMSNK